MLTQEEFAKVMMPHIANGAVYAKFAKIWARPAIEGEKIVTITGDGKETENTAKAGDFVVMAQTAACEKYIISGDKLAKRYTQLSAQTPAEQYTIFAGTLAKRDAAWRQYQATGEVRAIEFDPAALEMPDEIQFTAPWGEPMVCKKGDMLCTTDGKEVYRIARKEFEETYALKV